MFRLTERRIRRCDYRIHYCSWPSSSPRGGRSPMPTAPALARRRSEPLTQLLAIGQAGNSALPFRPPHIIHVSPTNKLEFDLLKVRGDCHIVVEFLVDLLAKRFGGFGFAVDQKRFAGRCVEFAQPAQDLSVVRVAA